VPTRKRLGVGPVGPEVGDEPHDEGERKSGDDRPVDSELPRSEVGHAQRLPLWSVSLMQPNWLLCGERSNAFHGEGRDARVHRVGTTKWRYGAGGVRGLLAPRYVSDVGPSATAGAVSSGESNDPRLLIWPVKLRNHLRRYGHPRPTAAATPSRICSRALPLTGSR
jgi:hypothetical protein